jgi:2',3'-cyclic-nucleotide 2'-phosphodiesterase (5'-nucleotidase family)
MPSSWPAKASKASVVRIYHTSDLHDHRGIVPRLKALRRAAPGLLFDCGDSLRGSQTVYYRNEPIAAELDAAGYDAQAVGNREFHYVFAALRARAERMRHPLVCSNLVDTKGRALPFARSLRFEVEAADGTMEARVHVLGLLVMQYQTNSIWESVFGWRFLEPIGVVEEYAREVGVRDMLVVLSHLGLDRDRELARRVPRIDVVLGGHSHDTLETPDRARDVPIVHAGPYGRFASRSEFAYDSNRGRFALTDFALVPLLAGP